MVKNGARSVGSMSSAYPGGRLHVTCCAVHIDNPDFATVPAARIFQLCEQHADLLNLLRQAGWSI
jgi:hypothetical protein